MKAQGWVKRALAAITAFGVLGLIGIQARAEDLLGQPTPGAIDFQPAASELKHKAIFFHNVILLPIITVITIFVAVLLLICIVRFNKRANPVPARWSHNTFIEVLWTGVPVLILMFIAIFSFKLLFAYHDIPKVDLTVKATGYQWYWGYEYPDQKIAEFTSNMLPEADAKTKGVPFRLAADTPLVVPVNKVVQVLVTGADVIHDFAMPAFGLKTDAIPGRVNRTWFRAEKVGTYYGQCSELCGVNHAFMPIEIKVVSEPDFEAWVASKAPKPAAPPPTTPAPAAAAALAPAPAAAAPAPAAPATTPAVPAKSN